MLYAIVIPTYNRTAYLKRILNYYNSHGKEIKIIIADSSSDEIKEENRKLIQDFLSIEIEHLTYYPSDINPHYKLADAIQQVEEEYCVFCADDDFVIPSGIEESINFLEKNLDYICAHGSYLNYKYDLKHNIFYWKKIYPFVSLSSNNPTERLKKNLQNYYQVLYAVHRTKQRKLIYADVLNSGVDPMQFGEIQPDLLSIISGRMKRIGTLYMMREAYSRVGGYWPASECWSSLIDYIEKNLYEEEYQKFKNCLAVYLSREACISLKEAMDIVHNSWQIYLNRLYHEDRALSVFRDISKLFESLNLLKLYNLFFQKFVEVNRMFHIKSWNTNTPYFDGFVRVKEYVIKHECNGEY